MTLTLSEGPLYCKEPICNGGQSLKVTVVEFIYKIYNYANI